MGGTTASMATLCDLDWSICAADLRGSAIGS